MRRNLADFWKRWETPILGAVVVIVTIILTTTVLQARHTAGQYGPLRRQVEQVTRNQVTNERQFQDRLTRELLRLGAEPASGAPQLIQYASPGPPPATTTTTTTSVLPQPPGAPQPPTTIVVATTVPPLPVTTPTSSPQQYVERLLALLPPAPASAPRCVVLTGAWCDLYRRLMYGAR